MKPHAFESQLGWVLLWVGLVVAASILYRLSRGKPILFFTVPGADFIEHTASGGLIGPRWRGFGEVSHCLVVAVARGRLVVRPFFPLNLLFLPELLGLELEVPLEKIRSVHEEKGYLRTYLRIAFDDVDQNRRKVLLALRGREELRRRLERSIGVDVHER